MWVRVRPFSSCCCWSRSRPLQLLEVVEAERLGEFLVELGLAGDLHRLDRDVERRRLALQLLGRIIVREGDLDLALVAGLGADQLLLEARDQLARAELDRHVLRPCRPRTARRRPLPTKSITTWSPFAALWPFLAHRSSSCLELASCLSCSSTAASSTSTVSRSSLRPSIFGVGHVGQRFEADLDLGVLAGLIALVELDLAAASPGAASCSCSSCWTLSWTARVERVAAAALRRASCGSGSAAPCRGGSRACAPAARSA